MSQNKYECLYTMTDIYIRTVTRVISILNKIKYLYLKLTLNKYLY